MRFCYINSVKRIGFFLGLLVITSGTLNAQTNTTSPYSLYGWGEIISPTLAYQMGMGGLSLPVKEGNLLNIENPAGWSDITKPVFDVGFSGQFLTLKSQGLEESGQSSYFRSMAFGFPISKRWGGGFGLQPFSTVGYDMSFTESDSLLGDITYRYHGNGGFNKAFAGASVDVIQNDSSSLTIGLNIGYLFGTINQFRRNIFAESEGFLNTRVQHSLIVNDFIYDLGLQYEGYLDSKQELKFIAGAHLQAPTNINAKKELLAVSYEAGAFGTDDVKDTVEYSPNENGSLVLPMKVGYGISLDYKSQLLVGVQYDRQDWNLYEEQFSDTVNGGLSSSSRFSLGVRYRPKPNLSPSAKMWNRATYKVGMRYGNNYLQLDDIHLEDKAVSLGVGFSLARQTSTINLGIEFGERGTEASNLILEQYTNFYIGVSLSPIERWFTKKQYD